MPRTKAPGQIRQASLESYQGSRSRKQDHSVGLKRKSRIRATKLLRQAIDTPRAVEAPALLGVRATGSGRKFIWEYDAILDAYLERAST